ncbi:MAG: adenosylcobinamide-GDP ribazoletransferase [Candidatus Hodgkinia cicadicola]
MVNRKRWFESRREDLTNSVSLFSCLPSAGKRRNGGRNPFKSVALASSIVCALACIVLALSTSAVGRALFVLTKGLLTGFIHDDGLIDWVDALLAPAKMAKVKMLKRYGVGACGSSLASALMLLEFALLSALTGEEAIEASTAAAVVGHLAALWHWTTTAHAYDRTVVWISSTRDTLVWTAALSAGLMNIYGWKQVTLVLAQQLVLLVSFNWLNVLAFGGRTGDSVGAIKKLAEVTCLMNLKSCAT